MLSVAPGTGGSRQFGCQFTVLSIAKKRFSGRLGVSIVKSIGNSFDIGNLKLRCWVFWDVGPERDVFDQRGF